MNFGAKYAVTPISKSNLIKKKNLLSDLEKARKLTKTDKGELAFIQRNSEIMELIKNSEKKK